MAMNDDSPPRFRIGVAIATFTIFCTISLFFNFNSEINLWASKINPQILEFYKAVLTVIVALIAAGIAAMIQWRQAKTAHNQWRTAQQKLNFKLFDRRFAIYTAVQELPSQLKSAEDAKSICAAYLEIIKPSEWLFDEEIYYSIGQVYIHDINKAQASLKVLKASTTFIQGKSPSINELEYYLWAALEQGKIKKMFKPFLILDKV